MSLRRFVSKLRKTSKAVGIPSLMLISKKQRSFYPSYVLIHFDTLIGVSFQQTDVS